MQNQTVHPDVDHHTVFESIARWVKNYRESLHASRELVQCGPEEVAAMAQDLMLRAHRRVEATGRYLSRGRVPGFRGVPPGFHSSNPILVFENGNFRR